MLGLRKSLEGSSQTIVVREKGSHRGKGVPPLGTGVAVLRKSLAMTLPSLTPQGGLTLAHTHSHATRVQLSSLAFAEAKMHYQLNVADAILHSPYI